MTPLLGEVLDSDGLMRCDRLLCGLRLMVRACLVTPGTWTKVCGMSMRMMLGHALFLVLCTFPFSFFLLFGHHACS